MKITPRLLSIPPYISTSWDHVFSIRMVSSHLIIELKTGATASIPGLSQSDIDAIFQAHAEFSALNQDTKKDLFDAALSFSLPMKTEGDLLESISAQLGHNEEQKTLPPLPSHILEKIGLVLKSLGVEDIMSLEPPKPDCNCIYCQLCKTVQKEEEIVTDSDLQFRDWEVTQKEDKLYHVKNPLDASEYYDVFLGTPIGCTCGSKHCEHIRAVLNS